MTLGRTDAAGQTRKEKPVGGRGRDLPGRAVKTASASSVWHRDAPLAWGFHSTHPRTEVAPMPEPHENAQAPETSDLVEESLVEEVSIDGMCGVY